jgi:hypothetical protein
MSSRTNKKWTKEEFAILKESVKKGKIPEIKGREARAVVSQMRKLKLTLLKRWSKKEIELLRNNKFVEGRSKNAISNKLIKLGIRKKREYRPKWSDADLKLLESLHNQGKSALSISKMKVFSYGTNAIQKKLCRLGMAKKLKSFVKFPEVVRLKFKKFLIENWQGKTPEDLMILWNKENSLYQTNKGKVVSYLTKLKIKIPYSEVQKINNLRKKEKEIISLNKNSVKNLEEKIRLERIKLIKSRIEKGRDIWTGMNTQEAATALLESSI